MTGRMLVRRAVRPGGDSAPAPGRTFGAYATNEPYPDLSAHYALEASLGKPLKTMSWFTDWAWDTFLTANANEAKAGGYSILYCWEAKAVPFSEIVSGARDAQITTWMTNAKNSGADVILRLFHEMNGNWYPWSVATSGSQVTSTAQWKTAWQRIYGIKQSVGATNVRFLFCANATDGGGVTMESYYPGDAYVDVVGIDGYAFSASTPTFASVFQNMYDRLRALAPTKTDMMIGEIGTASNVLTATQDTAWWSSFYDNTTMPLLDRVTFFHENEFQIDRVTATLALHKTRLPGGSGTVSPNPNAITQPPLGDEPGWTQLTRVGFDVACGRGGVRAAYPAMTTMEAVRGTNGTAFYRDSTAYVTEGSSELTADIGWYDGTDGGLAEYRGFYLLPTRYRAQLGGRTDIRTRHPDVLSGWKAIIIWYDNDGVWAKGELDPYETGSIGGTFKFYAHVVGDPETNASQKEPVWYPGTTTEVSMTNYNTISGRWISGEVSVWVNGVKAFASTDPRQSPSTPLSVRIGHEWSSLNANVPPNNKGRARVLYDWITTYDFNPDTFPLADVPTPRTLTVSGGALKAGTTTVRLSGANFYDAITSDAGTSPGNLEAMPGSVRRATLEELREVGANAVRAHTLFIGYGKTGTQMPTLGNYDEAVLVRCDEFLAECRIRNLYVMAPLTDSWNFYHGGAITFANMVLGGSRTDAQAQIEFCSNATVIAAFKAYVTTLMNRVNTVTGIAWKNDPTLAIIETANEAWQAPFQATTYAATGNIAWHAHIAAWLKTNFPSKLVADGFATSGSGATNRSYALGNPNFNILGTHLYDDQRNNITFVNTQANEARANGQAYIVGEWDWRDVANGGPAIQNSGVTRAQFLQGLDDNIAANGQLWWTPRVASRTHNGAYQLYLDAPANADQTSAKAQLTAFAVKYKGTRPDYTVTPADRKSL